MGAALAGTRFGFTTDANTVWFMRLNRLQNEKLIYTLKLENRPQSSTWAVTSGCSTSILAQASLMASMWWAGVWWRLASAASIAHLLSLPASGPCQSQ